MNVSADQVRAATQSAAAVITPENVPPLRLGEAPGRRRRPRRLSMAWAAPVAAVAAVGVIAAGSVAAGTWFARHGSGPSSVRSAVKEGVGDYTGPGTVPAYYVAIGNPSYAAVKATATGSTLAKIPAHVPFVGVTGAADDRTFVLDAQRQVMGPTVQWPGQPALSLLRLTAAGAAESLTRLAIPALPEGATVTGLALSPDGSNLAVEVGSGDVGQPGRQQIIIRTLATGMIRTWSANGSPDLKDPRGFTGSGVDGSQTISWTADSRILAFEWGGQSDVGVRLLDTTASGDNLIADSRPAITLSGLGPGSVSAVRGKDHVSECVTDAILTPDGSSIICGYTTTIGSFTQALDTTTGFIQYSARTGKMARVFGVFEFKGQAGGDIALYWTNPAGTVLIGAVLTPSGIRVGVIKGETFTPLPGIAGIADAAW
jgi:hypothetical protein